MNVESRLASIYSFKPNGSSQMLFQKFEKFTPISIQNEFSDFSNFKEFLGVNSEINQCELGHLTIFVNVA